MERIYGMRPARNLLLPLVLVALMAGSGCLLDFDQFEGDAGTVTPDPDAGDSGMIDGGPNGDSGMMPMPLIVGTTCTDDSVCGDGGSCVENYCTTSCDGTLLCPVGSECASFADQTYCLTTCEGECGSGQTCTTSFGLDNMPLAVCVPDADDDGIADRDDNCVDVPNPDQADLDGDGVGDACDTEAECPEGHMDGVLEYGSIGEELYGFGLPQIAEGPYLPIVGGFDSTEAPVSTVHLVDRSAVTVSESVFDMPYAAAEYAVASIRPDSFVTSPGAFTANGPQFGDWYSLLLEIGPQVGENPQRIIYKPVAAKGPDGLIYMVGYDNLDGPTFTWRIYRLNANGTLSVRLTAADGEQRRWSVSTDPQGRVYFYSDAPAGNGRLVTISPDGTLGLNNVSYIPDPTMPMAVDPVLVPGIGHVMWAYERATGAASRVSLRTLEVTPVPELDLSTGLENAEFATQTRGPAFVAVGTPAGGSGLSAVGFFLGCNPAFDAVDLDLDTVPDLKDNCPLDPNTDQTDTDADSIGDVCDDDDDSDGIADGSDSTVDAMDMVVDLSLDTDNDGVPNDADDDDDADGIADADDIFPFDTDNDGLHNGWDDDDDGDGYADGSETNQGTELDPARWPGMGTIVALKVDGGTRTAELHDLSTQSVTPLTLTAGEPYQPRFDNSGTFVLFLAGAPETTTSVEWLRLNNGASRGYDLGVTLRGAHPISVNVTTFDLGNVAVNYQDANAGWVLGRLGATTPASLAMTISVFGNLAGSDFDGGSVGFIDGPPGCDSCRRAYSSSVGGGTPLSFAPEVLSPRFVRYSGQFYVVGPSTEGRAGESVFVGSNAAMIEIPVPDNLVVNDVIGIENAGRSFVASVSVDGGPADVWVWNERSEEWHALIEGPEEYPELDWRP